MNFSKRKAFSGRSGKNDVNMMAEGSKCDLIYLMQVGIVQDCIYAEHLPHHSLYHVRCMLQAIFRQRRDAKKVTLCFFLPSCC